MDAFTLTRRCDGLVYHFARDPQMPGQFLRRDRPDLAITWEPAYGWVMRDPVSRALVGRLWDVPVADQRDATSAMGMWVTAKHDKSYIYDAAHGATE
ncbi:hypothetical protein [uncultured Tateyamaria sp.]|uniref:hypothetical protein n=1 Tax=uncultured Tateyamaria sp. TaxID=455651 RepID=UPI002632EDE5|nr:hypothetical protein [uncultured Tateyamaria sp.]